MQAEKSEDAKRTVDENELSERERDISCTRRHVDH
jgi:hypothetical protein